MQQELLTSEVQTRAAIISAAFLLFTGFIVARDVLGHPMIQKLAVRTYPPLVPAQNEQAKQEWAIIPFFYTFGAWPKRVFGDPVFYSLPYEVGPPTRFIGKITARWKMPDIQLTIEGPKSPARKTSREELKACFTSSFLHCPWIRKAVLERHILELLAAKATDWDISWFEVQSPPNAPGSAPQGLRLVGYGNNSVQERWILVTPQGRQQTLILQRSIGPEGEEASRLMQKLVQTLRVSDSLTFGQSLAALRLSEIHLGNFKASVDSPDLNLLLSEAQATLLAKISVNPGDLNAYFHLGGTSLLLLKHVAEMKKQASINSGPLSDKLLSLTQEWTASARPMIRSAIRYAEDIAPEDGQTQILRKMLKESENL